jgi:hypothetical protein
MAPTAPSSVTARRSSLDAASDLEKGKCVKSVEGRRFAVHHFSQQLIDAPSQLDSVFRKLGQPWRRQRQNLYVNACFIRQGQPLLVEVG